MNAKRWFYYSEGKVAGPVEEKQLRLMLANGTLPPDAQICEDSPNESARNWRSASEVNLSSEQTPRQAAPSESKTRQSPLVLLACIFFMIMFLWLNYNLMRIGANLNDISHELMSIDSELSSINGGLDGIRRALY